MKVFGTSVLVLLITALVGNAQAACGGGGWHSSRTTTTTYDSQPIVTSSEARHVVSTSVEPSRDTSYSRPAANSGALDTARFDAIAPRLNLSQKQWDRVQRAKQEVREDEQDNRSSRRNFSANAEFDRRLQSILSSEQMSIYRGSDRAR